MQKSRAANTVVSAASFGLVVLTPIAASADETDAKQILLNMSDYMTSAQSFEFDYDASLDVVTTDAQVLGIASSGTILVNRPDKIHARRIGGFADLEMFYDGNAFTLVGNHAGLYTQLPVTGTIDGLIDELRGSHGMPLPAADLLIENPYEVLMSDVTDVKDMGVGVISGRMCDHLAFRTPDVDWQIWISQGETPYPCRFVITTHSIDQGPQYRVDIRDWREVEDISAEKFTFQNEGAAEMIALEDYQTKVGDLPGHYQMGDSE
ncbi:hypothetical protein SAMN05444000_10392 [Shimia gijangensis]|uniref:DUF2092 domain-containing protein n=1 Tax=Shimia gijangensis TaxID=1470563 RepID=A0A1M6E318_9RHOB|nr:DUF2092 domain-containing protein [Shimia gijangensis]SHI79892.1 hypothetical protein SAMN05444000_10392 [Shimia gijangensis]